MIITLGLSIYMRLFSLKPTLYSGFVLKIPTDFSPLIILVRITCNSLWQMIAVLLEILLVCCHEDSENLGKVVKVQMKLKFC